jgi:hypothetical protein
MRLPCSTLQVVNRGQDMASEVKEGAKEISDGEDVSMDEAADKMKDVAKDVLTAARGKREE